jgi:hypothetical protein
MVVALAVVGGGSPCSGSARRWTYRRSYGEFIIAYNVARRSWCMSIVKDDDELSGFSGSTTFETTLFRVPEHRRPNLMTFDIALIPRGYPCFP